MALFVYGTKGKFSIIRVDRYGVRVTIITTCCLSVKKEIPRLSHLGRPLAFFLVLFFNRPKSRVMCKVLIPQPGDLMCVIIDSLLFVAGCCHQEVARNVTSAVAQGEIQN